MSPYQFLKKDFWRHLVAVVVLKQFLVIKQAFVCEFLKSLFVNLAFGPDFGTLSSCLYEVKNDINQHFDSFTSGRFESKVPFIASRFGVF